MVACIEEQGFEAKVDWNGGIVSVPQILPTSEGDQWQAASDRCLHQTGWGDWSLLTLDQRKLLYQQEIKEHRCLLALGVQTSDPPSEQTYMDTFYSAEHYYAALEMMDSRTLTITQMHDIVAACPPPTWFLDIYQ